MAFDAACVRTPQLAVRTAGADAPQQPSLQSSGYKVESIRYDPVLDQRWAVIASCGHPERPTFAVPVDSSLQDRSGAPSRRYGAIHEHAEIVRAGELVQAWQQQPNVRIEVAGRAEESGGIGNHVRIRVLQSGSETGQPLTVIGIVRGPGNVEIVQ